MLFPATGGLGVSFVYARYPFVVVLKGTPKGKPPCWRVQILKQDTPMLSFWADYIQSRLGFTFFKVAVMLYTTEKRATFLNAESAWGLALISQS